MADKTNTGDSNVQKSSEELFLRGSEKDEMLRKQNEDAGLKLDDSQEELSLQNIQRGSEQRTHPGEGVEKEGAGAERDESIGIKSESAKSAVQGSSTENNVGEQSKDEQTHHKSANSAAGNHAAETGRDVERSENSDQDTKRVLFNSDHAESGQGQVLFTEGVEKPPVTNTNEPVVDALDANDTDIDFINVAPDAGDEVQVHINEGAPVLDEQLQATDSNPGAELSYQVADGIDVPDGFTLSIDGNWHFDAQVSAYDHLGSGDSAVFSIPVVVTDEYGASDTTQIQITVHGTNDAPVVGAEVVTSIDEGAALISGQLTSTDVDDGATASFAVSEGSNLPDGFVLNTDGSYSFNPSDSAYEHLNIGDSAVLTIPVTVTDDNSASDTTQIQITVQGTNDAPVAGAEVIASVDEGAAVISGQLTSTDADDGAIATFAVSEGSSAPDGFVINADGSYSFDPADTAYDHLNIGDSQVITIPVTVTDEHGATDSSQIQITVAGTNDVPTISSTTTIQHIEENLEGFTGYGETWSGDVYSVITQEEMLQHLNISDVDSNNFTVTLANTDDGSNWHGGLAATDSSFSNPTSNNYDETVIQVTQGFLDNYPQVDAEVGDFYFDNVEFDQLNVGDVANISFTVQVSDGDAVSEPQIMNMEVIGTNDAPVIEAEVLSVVEGATAINGQLISTDIDDGATATFAITTGNSAPDGFVLSTDGSYSFDPADSAYDHLNIGDSEVLTIPVTVTDDQGATDTTQVQITVSGSNDVPTAIAFSGTSVDENATSGMVVAQMTTQDVDDGETFTYSIVDDASGLFEISGSQILVKAGAEVDFESGASHEVSVQVTDANGLTYTQAVSLTVNDINEAPTDIVFNAGGANVETALTVNYDGASNEYAAISDFNDFPTSTITLEIQLSSDAADVSNTSFASYATEGSNNEFLLFSNGNGDLNVYINGSAQNTGIDAADLIDGESHQLSVTWDSQSGELNVYVDGAAEYTGTHQQGSPIASGGTLVFGQEQDNVGGGFDANQNFEGTISDVRVFDEVRTPQQIADNANSDLSDPGAEPGLVSYYNFNSVNGNEVADLAGNNTLTIHNGASVGEVISVDENASAGTVVATLSAVDEDTADSHSYVLTDDASGYFEIVGNEVLVKAGASIDFETNASHDITVEVTDAAGNSYAETVTLNVNDLNEAATDIIVYGYDGSGEGALTVNDDGANNEYAAISEFNDFPTSTITLEMQLSSDAADISNTSFASYATEGSNNEFLLFSNGNGDLNVYINGTAHNTGIDAADLIDGESHQLSVTWDSQSGELNVYVDGAAEYTGTHQQGSPIASGGTLVFGQEQDNVGGGFDANQNFEGTISDVRVFDEVRTPQQIADNANSDLSDPGAEPGLVSYYNFNSVNGNEVADLAGNNSLTLHNGASVDSAFNAATAATVNENTEAGTVVATLSSVDADAGDSHVYAITDDASGFFEIVGNEVRVKTGADIDFENISNHDVTVQSTDSAGNEYSEVVSLTVNDVNEAPTDIVFNGDSVDENSVAGTVVATLSTTDEDSGESFSYALNDASGLFEISGDQVVVKVGADIDFESADSHELSVEVTDSAGNMLTENFTINVNDIVENIAPSAVDDGANNSVELTDSTTSNITIAASESISLNGSDNFSLSLSITPDGEQGNYDIIFNKENTVELAFNGDGNLKFAMQTEDEAWAWHDTDLTYDIDSINTIEFTYDGENVTISNTNSNGETTTYTQQYTGAVIDGGDDLMIGNRPYGNGIYSMDGEVDNVSMSVDGAEVVHLDFDGANQLVDTSGYGNDAVLGSGASIISIADSIPDAIENTSLIINTADLLANDTDADGDTLVITEVSATDATHGTVELVNKITFEDNFNDNNTDGWSEISFNGIDLGNWNNSDGAVGEQSNSAKGILAHEMGDDSSSTDYSVSVDIDANTGNTYNNGVGIVFGFEDNNNYFQASWDNYSTSYDASSSHKDFNLIKVVDGVKTVLDTVDAAELPNDFNLNISVDSNGVSVKVDGNELLTSNEQPALETIGLWTYDNDGGVSYDNVSVATDAAGQVIIFTPEANYTGEASFEYTISDGEGGTDTANVTLIVGQNVFHVGDGNRYHNITSDLSGEDLTGYTDVVGNASNDTIIGNEAVTNYDGGSGNDNITATSQNDNVTGGSGWDTLNGADGDDTFHVSGTGDGQDTVSGGAGNDTILGSDGDDTIGLKNFDGDNRVETIDGGDGTNTIQVGDNNRYHNTTSDFSETNLENIDSIVGTDSRDTIIGNDAVTNYDGGKYDDNITGGSGDDTIVGGHGNDSLAGGAGDDVLIGGAGNDTATGGEGNDTYVMNPFDGSDYFAGGEGGGWTDAIDISAVAANDPDNPWTIEVDGLQVEYEIAEGALALDPDTAGVISFGDGSELSFEGVERIEW